MPCRMVPYAMRHYDRESRAEPVPPLSGVCSWASVIRQGVGSKNLLSFVSVHFLYSWLLPAVQGSKEAKGGIVKEFYLVYIY